MSILLALKPLFKFLFVVLFLFTHFVSSKSARPYDKDINRSRFNVKIGLKKRNENLCPIEYQSCWCDYTNTNSNINLNSQSNDNINSKQFLSPSSPSSSQLSIMIDCQYFLTNDENLKLNNKSSKKIMLTEIPKITTGQIGSKFKYLSQITHLDLSRTAITEIPTDAFQVSATL